MLTVLNHDAVSRSITFALLVGFTAATPDVQQPTDPFNSWATAGVTALALALALLGLFIRGDIVPRSIYENQLSANSDLRQALKDLTATIAKQTDIEGQRLEWEKEQATHRRRREVD